MTRQNNEEPAISEDPRKGVQTRGVESFGGEKGFSVDEQAKQLSLFSETAENRGARASRVTAKRSRAKSGSATQVVPKSENKGRRETPATMREVVSRLRGAFKKVESNKGAPGPDGQSIREVREHFESLLPELSRQLLDGTYRPGAIRRVWIPKASGGQRGLGIPNVLDRMVQEAVRRVLEPMYERGFHSSSHGFRPGRSCHTAIEEACGYVDEGHEWVVDIDLKNFFDRVGHQRLMSRLALRVKDVSLLKLINRWLQADIVMPDGVKVNRERGVPQGGPLSPLLSNIVLDEFDWELEQRGHRFVRYADDCNVYVRSERAGQRVMASLTRFLERRLRLEVNEDKSAVARTGERHFVGFNLRCEPMEASVEVWPSERSRERINSRVRELTPRNWGGSLRGCIAKVNEYLRGWFGFFKVCTRQAHWLFLRIDAHIRRRLRALQLKHWKRRHTMARKLTQLGVKRKIAWRRIYEGRKSWWNLSHDYAVDRGLRNAYFAERGLFSIAERLAEHHEQLVAPAQLVLGMG